MKKRTIGISIRSFILVLFLSFNLFGQEENILSDLLYNDTSAIVKLVLSDPEKYKLQIIYGQINRSESLSTDIKNFYFRNKPEEYFYPASMVKLPCAALALEKLRTIPSKSVNRYTPFKPRGNYKCKKSSRYLASEPPETMASLIRKVFAVSDNDAYNKIYEFLGQRYIHERLAKLGYDSARIVQKFTSCGPNGNKNTGPITFYNGRKAIYTQARQGYATDLSIPLNNTILGTKYLSGNRIRGYGMNFKYSNFISLKDLHKILISICLPNSVDPKHRFNLRESDYAFLHKSMAMYPRELEAKYANQPDKYPDGFVKYIWAGNSMERLDSNVIVMNKVGQFFGYLTDCSYIKDVKNNKDFFVSSVIYVNESEVINGGKYEYTTIGIPFLHRLGQILYNYELKREVVKN